MKSLVILATGVGLGGSAAATYRAHRKPMSPEWDEPVANTRFRRSDLPIGGALATALAFGSLVTGHRKAAAVLAGAGLGATAGSLGVALLEPLAPTESTADESPSAMAEEPPMSPESDRESAEPAAGDTAGWTGLAEGTVTMSGLSGADSAALADADEALGGLSTDTADWIAAEARAEASLSVPEQEPDQTPGPGPAQASPDASESGWAPPSSGPYDVGDEDEDEAEEQLVQAEEAVAHVASYSSASLDDVPPDSGDEVAPEGIVTGSAPQEGELPNEDT